MLSSMEESRDWPEMFCWKTADLTLFFDCADSSSSVINDLLFKSWEMLSLQETAAVVSLNSCQTQCAAE